MAKKTLQSYADAAVAPEYRQQLKTLRDALAVHGWALEDKPLCCGERTEVRSFLGDAYVAECKRCGRFIADVTGPVFSESGSSVQFLDGEKTDIDVDERWIAGTKPTISFVSK